MRNKISLLQISPYLLLLLLMNTTVVSAAEPPAMPVIVANPEVRELIEYDEFTGRFEAYQDVEVRARVSGYLDQIHFKDGQQVKKGDVLFTIDPRPYQAVSDAAKAEVSRTKSELALANQELVRAKRLLKIKAISKEEFDTRAATLQVATANIEAAQANSRTAELDLEYTKILSPIDGHISNRRIDVGNLIQSGGGQILTSIVSMDPVYFVFDVSESDYLRYQRRLIDKENDGLNDNNVSVSVRLLDEKVFSHVGTLNFIDNKFDVGTSTIRLRATFEGNAQGLLLPGIFGRVQIPVSDKRATMLIPDQAILADMASKVVMTVNEEDVVVPKQVEIGNLYQGQRIIKSGLTANDRVVIEGVFRARPGAKVAPKMADAEAK